MSFRCKPKLSLRVLVRQHQVSSGTTPIIPKRFQWDSTLCCPKTRPSYSGCCPRTTHNCLEPTQVNPWNKLTYFASRSQITWLAFHKMTWKGKPQVAIWIKQPMPPWSPTMVVLHKAHPMHGELMWKGMSNTLLPLPFLHFRAHNVPQNKRMTFGTSLPFPSLN